MKYIAQSGLFDIEVPDEWGIEFEDKIYTFIPDTTPGVLQISLYYSETEVFSLDDEFFDDIRNHSSAQMENIGEYESIRNTEYSEEDDMVMYSWILGKNKIMIHTTIVIDATLSDDEIETSYELLSKVLRTIKLKDV